MSLLTLDTLLDTGGGVAGNFTGLPLLLTSSLAAGGVGSSTFAALPLLLSSSASPGGGGTATGCQLPLLLSGAAAPPTAPVFRLGGLDVPLASWTWQPYSPYYYRQFALYAYTAGTVAVVPTSGDDFTFVGREARFNFQGSEAR